MDDDNSSKCSMEKKALEFDDQNQSNQKWPQWLPSDWFIHRDINTPQPQVFYSNPRGKTFHSEEQVLQYLAKETQKKPKRSVTKRTNRKITEPIDDPKENKITPEVALQCLGNPDWPDWLPQDWYIERDGENPNTVHYCSPKWKRFRTKDEVLHHIEALSKKVAKKPRKKMKKILESKDSSVHQQ